MPKRRKIEVPSSTGRSSKRTKANSSKTAKKEEPPAPAVLSKADLHKIENCEEFVRRQYELCNEGQMKKQKCRHCVSYFRNALLTLQTHLSDKCVEFAECRQKASDKRKALNINSGPRKKSESRPTRRSVQTGSSSGKPKGKQRATKGTQTSPDEDKPLVLFTIKNEEVDDPNVETAPNVEGNSTSPPQQAMVGCSRRKRNPKLNIVID